MTELATQEKIQDKKNKKDNPLLNISLNVVIPSVIMTKFSNEQYLGQVWGLIIALALPLGYGIVDLLIKKKVNFFSALGLFSILITGGIGLMKLDRNWMIAKETGIPFIMGIGVVISQFTGHPLVKTFLDQMIDLDKVNAGFQQEGHGHLFDRILNGSSWALAGTFFVSAALNFFLAVWILKGQPGTVEFNESLGKMTALSFPVISVPMMIMVGLIMAYIFNSIKKKTSLDIESIFRH